VLAIDLDGLEEVGRHAEARSTSGVSSPLRNTLPLPVWALVAVTA